MTDANPQQSVDPSPFDSPSGQALRQNAEERLRKGAADSGAISPDDAQRLLHELQVHQIELEMQNEELRRTQVELQASRARYFDLYNLAPVGYFTLSEQGLILDANLTAAALLGVDRSRLVKQPISRFIFPEDQDLYYLFRNQLFETGAPQVCELRLARARKDGDLRPAWAHLQAVAAQGSEGAPVWRVTLSDITERKTLQAKSEEVLRQAHDELERRVAERTEELKRANEALRTDITERRQAEAALRESEEKYRAVVEDQSELVCRFLPGGTLTFVNGAYCRYFGRERADLVGHSFLPLIPEEDRQVISQRLALISKENPVVTIEHRVILLDGQIRWQQWSNRGIFDVEGHLLEFQAIGRDITERKQAEDEIHQRNRELVLLNRASQTFNSTLDPDQVLAAVLEEVRQQLDVTACSVWLIDPATGGLVCQQATGPQHEIVRGWRLAPGQGIAGWVAQSGESLNLPDVWADERYFRGVDQQTGLPLRCVLTVPLRVKQSVIGVLQAVDTGIGRFSATDVRLLESLAATAAIAIENARLYDQVKQDAETKSLLLHEINHRVKNNLTAIIGLLYVEQRYAKAQDRPAWQAIVQDLSDRIQGLAVVHSLLTATEWAPLSLSELTLQIIHAALQMLPSSQRVLVDVSPSPARVTPKQANSLALVLHELTTNTAKYAASEDRTAHIGVRIVSDGDTLIEFRDDGPGFPDDVLRLERHNVGLYLVNLLVRDDLRGDYTLHNDGGAVITIRFKG